MYEFINLKSIFLKLKNNESKPNDYFRKIRNTSYTIDYHQNLIKILTSQNRQKNSGILIALNLKSFNVRIKIDIKILQCSNPIIEIKDKNFNSLEKIKFNYVGNGIHSAVFQLNQLLNNEYLQPSFDIFILEQATSLPKKIFNITDIHVEYLGNSNDDKEGHNHHNNSNNLDILNNYSQIKNDDFENSDESLIRDNSKYINIDSNLDYKNDNLLNSNQSKLILPNKDNHDLTINTKDDDYKKSCPIEHADVTINNIDVDFKASCPIEHINNVDSCISHVSCKGNIDYFKLFSHVDKLHLPIANYVYYASNSVVDNVEHDTFNRDIPLGYNIFGQFVVHDMTFNTLGKILSQPVSFVNHETIKLDLHCLYGNSQDLFYFHDDKFVFNDSNNDLPRNYKGKPIIPDPRNEENYLIAQMHILFMKFHNKLIDFYKPTIKDNLFKFVKKQVTFYYQWLIINDFLPRWVDNNIIEELFTNFNFIYQPNKQNALPIEWAMVAARTGHMNFPSHIRIAYDLIISEKEIHLFTKGKLPKYNLDWSNLFEMTLKEYDINYCKKYDGKIISDLADMTHLSKPPDLPSRENNLLLRNLLRGSQFGIGSGQDYAENLNIKKIPEILLKQYDHGRLLESSFMIKETPLLLYILKESEIYKSGNQLTGVGGRLFTEPILAILFNDSESYLQSKEIWKPIIGKNNEFTFMDLIAFVYS